MNTLIELYIENTADIYKENLTIKKLLRTVLHFDLDLFTNHFGDHFKVRSDDTCELPAAAENPSKFKSVKVALAVAAANMVRKKLG